MSNRWSTFWTERRIAELCERYGNGEKLGEIARDGRRR